MTRNVLFVVEDVYVESVFISVQLDFTSDWSDTSQSYEVMPGVIGRLHSRISLFEYKRNVMGSYS